MKSPACRFVLATLVALALTPRTAAAEEEPRGGACPHACLGLDGFDVFAERDRDPARLQHLTGIGPAFARTVEIAWGRVERRPPRGGPPAYDWKPIDEAVLVWQLAGLEPVPVLSPRSSWAGVPADKSDWARAVRARLPAAQAQAALATARGATAPRPDTWSRWERFVRAFVERYDGDGKQDMAGLRRPLRHVQVLAQADVPGGWLGSADEYLRLLHHAGVGAKSAHADTLVLAATVDVRGTGHEPYPDPREWDFRIGRLAPRSAPLARLETERSFAMLRRLLEVPHLYDVLPQAGGDNHPDDVSNLRFLRRSLDERGGREVALWLVGNPTRKVGVARHPAAVPPRTEELRLRRRWLPPALNPAHSDHARALPWLRRGQAFDLLRSLCRSRAAGADVVLFLAPWDVLPEGHPRGRSGAHQGMLARDPLGPPTASYRRTPSWYALAQANRLLRGHRSAGEAPLGSPGRSVVYRFPEEHEEPWIAVLLLDERLSWGGEPGLPLPLRAVTVPLPNGRYRLEATRLGPEEPQRRTVTVVHGMLELHLGPAPLYVIPLE